MPLPRAQPAPAADGAVVSKAVMRAAERLAVSNRSLARILGVSWSLDLIKGHLEALGFTCAPAGPDSLAVNPPYWRTDIRLTEDLVEEVARSVTRGATLVHFLVDGEPLVTLFVRV